MGSNHFQVFNFPKESTGNSGAFYGGLRPSCESGTAPPTSEEIKQAFEDSDFNYEVECSEAVTSVALTRDGRYLLCNVSLKNPRLELYDLERNKKGADLVRRYKGGHSQSMFVLRCGFGGAMQQFVACGSEDASVAVWSRDRGELVARLSGGHAQVVNCVSWSPADARLLVTASDDQTVRVWGTEDMPQWDVAEPKQLRRTDLSLPSQAVGRGAGGLASEEDDLEDESLEESEDEREVN
jgi:WD40 repeat protein